MKIYKVNIGDKIVTAKREKLSKLSNECITVPHVKIDTDEVFVRCSKKGKTKFYNKQHIIYPINCEVVEVFDYDPTIVRLFKKALSIF